MTLAALDSEEHEMKLDLVGKRFGHYVVVGMGAAKHWRNAPVKVQCDCGATVTKTAGNVVGTPGKTRTNRYCSLRCPLYVPGNVKHRMSGQPGYAAWAAMRYRCEKPSSLLYKHYGALGIRVDPKWTASFNAFWEDMKDTHFPRAELELLDPKVGYCKTNCRWVTRKHQAQKRATEDAKPTLLTDILEKAKKTQGSLTPSEVMKLISYTEAVKELFDAYVTDKDEEP